MNNSEKKIVLEAKRNEAESLYKKLSAKGSYSQIDTYREMENMSDWEKKSFIAELYEEGLTTCYNEKEVIMIEFLKSTEVSKYVELAKVMERFLGIGDTKNTVFML